MFKCIIVDKDKSSRTEIQKWVIRVKEVEVLIACGKLTDAFPLLSSQPVDVLFLDTPGEGKGGVGLLQKLKHEKPKIIITSLRQDIAKEAFDIGAVDFILKPVTAANVVRGLAKALQFNNDNGRELVNSIGSVFIKDGQQFVKTNLHDISVVEALADYVNIYTTSKRYTVHSTMKRMVNKLPSRDFVRVHKSYIVSIDKVTEVSREALYIDKKVIPVGDTFRDDLMSRLKII